MKSPKFMPYEKKADRWSIVRNEEIQHILTSIPMSGKHLIARAMIPDGFPAQILEDHAVHNNAEVHTHVGDLWLCLEGSATFRCGGILKNPQAYVDPSGRSQHDEWQAEEIEGGTDVALKPGDWLWIPPGEPHQHWTDTTARLMIIKIPV